MILSTNLTVVMALGASVLISVTCNAQEYDEVSFYVCAHQDDWQLFMGTNAFNDIGTYDERKKEANGKKVVFIYTTAGNLDDEDDKKTCDCKETRSIIPYKVPYWKVRETGAKNSVHLAACKAGGKGPGIPYPLNSSGKFKGHVIARYCYKNTVSYFLRIKSGQYGRWYDSDNFQAGTVDNSTTYKSRSDLEHTLSAIFEAELTSGVKSGRASFHIPDTDESININDHHDHIIAGRCAAAAIGMLCRKRNTSFSLALFTNYHTQNLPPNIAEPDIQNEAALTAVYCLALLDQNAWPEWGTTYHNWTNRNYFRLININPRRK